MKKFMFLRVLFVFFLFITFTTTLYGAGTFKRHYNKGIEFYKQGKYDRAGKEFEEAIKIKPNDVYAIYGLGNTYYCKAMYDEAVKTYKKAININPDYAKVHYSLSLAYSKMGMTSEAEKQKKIFRKLSQGGTSAKRSTTHAKVSHTSKHKSNDHAPKKSLSHAPTKSLSHTQKKTLHDKKNLDTHSTHKEKVSAHTTQAPIKHDNGHQKTKHQEKNVYERHKSPVAWRSKKNEDSHSIFKGFSGEKRKADKRVFTKTHHDHKKNKIFVNFQNPLNSIKHFIEDKWHTSATNRIWICAAGYIFATQVWLGVVAFFCVIVWRIREKS